MMRMETIQRAIYTISQLQLKKYEWVYCHDGTKRWLLYMSETKKLMNASEILIIVLDGIKLN